MQKDVPVRSSRLDQRDAILDATIDVALQRGLGQVTLDAVAAQAGLSKGGLLYHFSSKQSLVEGLLEKYLDPNLVCDAAFDGVNHRMLTVLIAAADSFTHLEKAAQRLRIPIDTTPDDNHARWDLLNRCIAIASPLGRDRR